MFCTGSAIALSLWMKRLLRRSPIKAGPANQNDCRFAASKWGLPLHRPHWPFLAKCKLSDRPLERTHLRKCRACGRRRRYWQRSRMYRVSLPRTNIHARRNVAHKSPPKHAGSSCISLACCACVCIVSCKRVEMRKQAPARANYPDGRPTPRIA